MIQELAPLAALAALLALASAWDVRSRKIPNALTVAIALGGVAVRVASSGARGAVEGIAAAAIVLAALWIPWRKRAVGGGDLKLAVGTAVWLGVEPLWTWAIASALAAGALSVGCYALSARDARAEMRANVRHAALGLGSRPVITASGRTPVPAGLAIALGAAAVVLAR